MNAFTKSTSASTRENNFVHFANFIFSMVGGRGGGKQVQAKIER